MYYDRFKAVTNGLTLRRHRHEHPPRKTNILKENTWSSKPTHNTLREVVHEPSSPVTGIWRYYKEKFDKSFLIISRLNLFNFSIRAFRSWFKTRRTWRGWELARNDETRAIRAAISALTSTTYEFLRPNRVKQGHRTVGTGFPLLLLHVAAFHASKE